MAKAMKQPKLKFRLKLMKAVNKLKKSKDEKGKNGKKAKAMKAMKVVNKDLLLYVSCFQTP